MASMDSASPVISLTLSPYSNASDDGDSLFVLSVANSPAADGSPSSLPESARIRRDDEAARIKAVYIGAGPDGSQNASGLKHDPIEVPVLRKFNTITAIPPRSPLSYGEPLGGYFSVHNKTGMGQSRPFHLHSTRIQDTSRPLAAGSAPTAVNRSISGPTVPRPDRGTALRTEALPASSSNTPVTYYLPSGSHDSPLPMGKYYPSNYGKWSRDQGSSSPSRLHSSPQLGVHQEVSANASGRPDLELKQKLGQYRRDMISQTTLAANGALREAARAGAVASVELDSRWSSIMAFSSRSNGTRPMSPRLLPLGSPGPVTPMQLEDSADSYTVKGRGLAGPFGD